MKPSFRMVVIKLALVQALLLSVETSTDSYFGFRVFKSSMIDVTSSDPRGAKLIGSSDIGENGTTQQCIETCTKTSNCDTVVHSMRSNKCALYECGAPTTCVAALDSHPLYNLAVREQQPTPIVTSGEESVFDFPQRGDDDMLSGSDINDQGSSQDQTDPCLLPKKIGPCRAAIPRFFFDASSEKCIMFTYGGCRANTNNFKSIEDCENRCVVSGGEDSDESSDDRDKDVQISTGEAIGKPPSAAAAHRDKARVGDNGVEDNKIVNAIIPLALGVLLCTLLLLFMGIRCNLNRRRGPTKFRKFVFEDDHPAQKEVVNGLFA